MRKGNIKEKGTPEERGRDDLGDDVRLIYKGERKWENKFSFLRQIIAHILPRADILSLFIFS